MKLNLILFLLFPIILWSQSKVDFGRINSGGINPSIRLDIKSIREEIFESIPKELKGDVSDRSLMRYSNIAAENLSQLLEEGAIYTNWPEAEGYINDILELIKKSSGLSNMSNIKAYVVKNGYPNAFMTPSGAMFITIGMLNEIEDESSLAGILSHELAHYSLHHNIEGFIKEVQGDFNPSIFFSSNKATSRYSIDNELGADKLASEYLVKSGYNYKGLIKAFELSKRIENKQLLRDSYSYKVEETTHPSSDNRLKKLTEGSVKATRKYGDGKEHIVDSLVFEQIKQESGIEILRLLLSSYDYRTCLERAFLYHIYDPNNATYIYYLMESIRRMCYFNIDQWSEKFIVDQYYEFTQGFGEGDKRKIRDDFFSKFRYHLLGIKDSDYEDVVAKFYWEEDPKFITYEQAFQFFFEIGKLLDEPECYLSNALSLSFDKGKMNVSLEKYISYNSGKYLNFAKALKSENIYGDLNNETLLVFDNFVGVVKQGPDYVVLRNNQEDISLKKEIGGISGYRKYLYLKDLVSEDIEDFSVFTELEKFSILTFITKGNELKLYELNPDYWIFFKKYGFNKVEFINCFYKDKVKGKYSKEVYLNVADSKIDDYLKIEERKNRTLSVFITSVSMKFGEKAKKQFFETDIFLKKEGSGYHQLIEKLEEGLNSIE